MHLYLLPFLFFFVIFVLSYTCVVPIVLWTVCICALPNWRNKDINYVISLGKYMHAHNPSFSSRVPKNGIANLPVPIQSSVELILHTATIIIRPTAAAAATTTFCICLNRLFFQNLLQVRPGPPEVFQRIKLPVQDQARALGASISRLPEDWRRPRGRPRQSWLRTVEADLKPLNFDLQPCGRSFRLTSVTETAMLLDERATP